MNFDLKRLESGELIAAAAGLLLFVSMFLPWFQADVTPPGVEELCGPGEESCSGFDTFNLFSLFVIPGLDLLMVGAAAAPWILLWIIIRGHELSWPPGEVTAIVGIIAATLVFYNGVIDRVGESREFVSLDVGWYLALLASIMMLVGAGISRLSRGGDIRRPPGTF